MKHRDYMRELLKMSDEAIMEALNSSEFHRDLAQKHVDGADFMDADGRYYGSPYFCGSRDTYIEKPKTIKITIEIPEPSYVDQYNAFFNSLEEKRKFHTALYEAIIKESQK